MASTVTDMQSGSLDSRREGVGVLTKEQQFGGSIIRIRPNSKDLFVHNGRIVNDNFFDENLLDPNQPGSITSAPSNFAEKRTLGQGVNTEIVYTDIRDFNPVEYINDESLAMYPIILTALGYANQLVEDGTIGVFETRSEIVGLRYNPDFAKRGLKSSLCSSTEDINHKFYEIEQLLPRNYESSLDKAPAYFEVGDDTYINEFITYQDVAPTNSTPYVDTQDTVVAANAILGGSDTEMTRIILQGTCGAQYVNITKISAAAGWTFINKSNGTDSIVYSDRI